MNLRHAMIALAVMTTPTAAEPINPAVTPATIRQTICVPGWTRTVRPPVSYTRRIKSDQLRAAGLSPADASRFELDHVVPLSLGGAPRDPVNLRLQLWPEARIKDRIEDCLSRAVCRGALSLDAARQSIWTNWRASACPAR